MCQSFARMLADQERKGRHNAPSLSGSFELPRQSSLSTSFCCRCFLTALTYSSSYLWLIFRCKTPNGHEKLMALRHVFLLYHSIAICIVNLNCKLPCLDASIPCMYRRNSRTASTYPRLSASNEHDVCSRNIPAATS